MFSGERYICTLSCHTVTVSPSEPPLLPLFVGQMDFISKHLAVSRVVIPAVVTQPAMITLLLSSLLLLSNSLPCQAVVAPSQLDRLAAEVSLLSQNIQQMKESFTASLTVIVEQLDGISHKLDTKVPVRVLRTRGGLTGAKNVVYSSGDNQEEEEEEEEDMREVENQVLTLFRRMISRGRQRKFPLEKIQTEISSVRSGQSYVLTTFTPLTSPLQGCRIDMTNKPIEVFSS